MDTSDKSATPEDRTRDGSVSDPAWLTSLALFLFAALLHRGSSTTWNIIGTVLSAVGLVVWAVVVMRARRVGVGSRWLGATSTLAAVGITVATVAIWV